MKPVWEYRWQYTDERSGTPVLSATWLTDDEVIYWYGNGMPDAQRLDETRRDRNLHPLPKARPWRATLPEFEAPRLDELREFWQRYRGNPDIERLILEVVTLRRALREIEEWRKLAEQAPDKGDIGRARGPLFLLRNMLRRQRERTGDE